MRDCNTLHHPLHEKSLTCNYSLQFPHNFQQTVNKNTQTHQVEVVVLIFQQILVTNLQGIV